MSEATGMPNTGIYGTMLKKAAIAELLSSDWRKRETYITRGAFMYCTKGTHEEVLNQLEVNGVYVNKNPIMTVNDCKVSTSVSHDADSYLGDYYEEPGTVIDGNIHSFGFCKSEFHPSKVFETTFTPKEMYREFSYNFEPDQPVSGTNPDQNNKIYPCVPKLVSSSANPMKSGAALAMAAGGGAAAAAISSIADAIEARWENGSDTLFINGVPALTSKSCLTCAYGGKIGFLTNGMDMPPFEFVEHNLKQG